MPFVKLESNVNNTKLNNILSNGLVFVGVFSKSCHHCLEMKPEWKKLVSLIIKKKIKATILEIDARLLSSITNSLITNNTQGFPSLFLIKNNKLVTSYNSERKADKFLQFLNKYTYNIPKMLTKKAHIKRRNKRRNIITKKFYN